MTVKMTQSQLTLAHGETAHWLLCTQHGGADPGAPQVQPCPHSPVLILRNDWTCSEHPPERPSG